MASPSPVNHVQFWGAPCSKAAKAAIDAELLSSGGLAEVIPIPDWDEEIVGVRGVVPPVGTPTETYVLSVTVDWDGTCRVIRRFIGFTVTGCRGGARLPQPPSATMRIKLVSAKVDMSLVDVYGDGNAAAVPVMLLEKEQSGRCPHCSKEL